MSTRILAGRYELLEKIGSGGMAVVYKARCRLLNRYVAIKILKPEFIKDMKFIESFKRESQAAASLSHPNIVNVYDVGREGNIHYIVMELIEGEPLSEKIRRDGPLPYNEAIRITKEVASALSLAHKNQIIHRDVKPHNILITQTGTAKITDFGIAKAVNSATLVGNTETVMGSVHYFSPEQARGGYVDEKSDIYSLGIVLYEMLTGNVPFDGENPVAVALMHINQEMVPPSQVVKGIPPRLEQIVMKATDKFQVNRYKSADEMLKALEDLEFVTKIVGNPSFDEASHRLSEQDGISSKEQRETVKEEDGSSLGKSQDRVEKEKKPGKKIKINKMKVLAIVLALVCAVPASRLIVNGISSLSAEKTVKVPYLVGMTLEEGKDELEALGLVLVEGDKVVSEFEEGIIVSQDTEEGTETKKGKEIKVSISKGVKEGTVPKLDGIPSTEAEMIIKKYGYRLGAMTPAPSILPKGFVVSQTPAAGEKAKDGTVISLVISTGSEEGTVTMPKLIGKDLSIAKELLESLGLKVGTPTYEVSSTYKENQVIWQEYEAETSVAKGTVVNLKIAGTGETAGSRSIPLTISYNLADNQVFYLTVTVSDESGTHNILTNQQRAKDDGYEIVTLTGTGKGSVTVVIDNNVVLKKTVDFNTGEMN